VSTQINEMNIIYIMLVGQYMSFELLDMGITDIMSDTLNNIKSKNQNKNAVRNKPLS
jgi:hypothetical protein